jgi:hypothetical protein
VSFLCVRAFPAILEQSHSSSPSPNSKALNRVVAFLGAIAAVVLVIGYLSSAAALQEDLRSPSRYAAQHEHPGDVIALPDHAITAAVDSYLGGEDPSIPHWPQLGVEQRYVEGFDLSLHPAFFGSFPRRVWLVTDGSVPGIGKFERDLDRDGYVLSENNQFTGVSLLLYSLSGAKANGHS